MRLLRLYSRSGFRIAWIVALLALPSVLVRADFVVLKNGAIIEGKVYRQTDKFIYMTVNDGSGTVRFHIDEIDTEKTSSLNYEESHAAKTESTDLTAAAPADEQPATTVPETEPMASPDPATTPEPAPATADGSKDNHPLIPVVNQYFDALRAGDATATSDTKNKLLAQPNEACYAIVQRLHSAATPDEEQWAVDLLLESQAEKTEEAISAMLRDVRPSHNLKSILMNNLDLRTYPRLTPLVMKNEQAGDVELTRAILNCLSTCRSSNEAIKFLAAYLPDHELGGNAKDSLVAILDEFKDSFKQGTPAPEFDPIRMLLDILRDKITDSHKAGVLLLLQTVFEVRGDAVAPANNAPYDPKNDAAKPEEKKAYQAAVKKAKEADEALIRRIQTYYANDFKRSIGNLLSTSKSDIVRAQTVNLIAALRLSDYYVTLRDWIEDDKVPAAVRMAAIHAMAAYDDEDCYDALVEALRDKDKGVQHAAFVTLVTMTGEQIDASYARWRTWLTKKHPNTEPRENATVEEEEEAPEQEENVEEETEDEEEAALPLQHTQYRRA